MPYYSGIISKNVLVARRRHAGFLAYKTLYLLTRTPPVVRTRYL